MKPSWEMTGLAMDSTRATPSAGAADAAALNILSDEALMERVGRGDEPAYRILVERHLARHVGFAARLLGDRSEGEEVMQEAFLKLWRGAPNWQAGGARFTTWFYRVVMNLCIDRQRRRRGRAVPIEDAGDPADERRRADETIQDRQVGRQIDGALAELPDRQRQALSLCYLQGLSNREAAQVLEVNIKALESLLTRGRAALKQKLGHLKDELTGVTP